MFAAWNKRKIGFAAVLGCLIAVVLYAAAVSPAAADGDDPVLGDVNGDGFVTPADALLIYKHLAAPFLDAAQLQRADVDGNGDITADDALFVKQYYLRKTDAFQFTYTALDPAAGAGHFGGTSLKLTFLSSVYAQSGKEVRVKKAEDDSLVDAFDVSNAGKVAVDGNEVTLTPLPLEEGTGYYVEIDSGAFIDGRNHTFAGLAGQDAWHFAVGSAVYVQAGAVDGDGSQASPFGTIAEGIAAATDGGTVVVQAGTYPVESSISIDKAITVLGENGVQIMLNAVEAPFIVNASHTTLEGLTMTSNIPFSVEFIRVAASHVTIRNNTIYGPPQIGPSSGWVVNRAFVAQNNVSDLLVEGNTMYSLRQAGYLNPNVTGTIRDNTAYHTRNAYMIDGALVHFEGNSWGDPANDTDISLLAGTTSDPAGPYGDLADLSNRNHSAVISDQR